VVCTAVEVYSAAFVARFRRESVGDPVPLSEPGLRGVVSADEKRIVRLLVMDDRGYGRLATEVGVARQGVAHVFDRASRCDAFLRDQSGWKADRPATAMALCDIDAVSVATLPDGLVLRPVKRVPRETGAVPLEAAVAVAMASDPGITEPADELTGFLRSLPASVRLLSAVDERGVPRATSGYDVFGEYARIFFVNTEPGWRRRGIGQAMTVEALRAAASSGARRAILDATDSGASVYLRLGFEVVGRLTRYARAS
jgi:ribosomal protein S18 acetylase RimI-like enzyme